MRFFKVSVTSELIMSIISKGTSKTVVTGEKFPEDAFMVDQRFNPNTRCVEMIFESSPWPTLAEPSNIMCSKKWAKPVRPGSSRSEPTWKVTST